MKVCLYARVSSEKQDTDLSLSAQLRALRAYAETRGYEVAREFVDEAETGRTTARPAFKEMIAVARRPQKPFQAILVWKFSRFARNREDSIVFKALLRKNGVQVISINEPSEDTPTGRLMEAIIESLDEFYSANLGEEVMRGIMESASRGFFVSGTVPYGYKRIKVRDGAKDRSKLDIEPTQAPIVKRAFDEVLCGNGLKEICKGLNHDGIPGPRGKSWCVTSLWQVITNEVCTGTLIWGKHSRNKKDMVPIRVENAWPPIIDYNEFYKVQDLLASRAPSKVHPKRVSSQYLLSGLVKCGACGKALIGQEAKSGQFAYYVCGNLLKKGAGSCKTGYLNARKFERRVIDEIMANVLNEPNLCEMLKLISEEEESVSLESHSRLKIVCTELADVERKLEAMYDALESRSFTFEDLAPRIKQLRSQQSQLETAKSELDQPLSDQRVRRIDLKTLIDYSTDMGQVLHDGKLGEQKAVFRAFVEGIKVLGDTIEIEYRFPIPDWQKETGVNTVLDTIQIGSPVCSKYRTFRAEFDLVV